MAVTGGAISTTRRTPTWRLWRSSSGRSMARQMLGRHVSALPKRHLSVTGQGGKAFRQRKKTAQSFLKLEGNAVAIGLIGLAVRRPPEQTGAESYALSRGADFTGCHRRPRERAPH